MPPDSQQQSVNKRAAAQQARRARERQAAGPSSQPPPPPRPRIFRGCGEAQRERQQRLRLDQLQEPTAASLAQRQHKDGEVDSGHVEQDRGTNENPRQQQLSSLPR